MFENNNKIMWSNGYIWHLCYYHHHHHHIATTEFPIIIILSMDVCLWWVYLHILSVVYIYSGKTVVLFISPVCRPCVQTSVQTSDVIMGAMAYQITSLTIIYSTVFSGADQRKHQRSARLAFVWGIHWWRVNSPNKWPVTRKMFPFDDVIVG